ncbi:MAG: hypothetical protein ACOX8U_05890 [Bradymonadia bacterium]|jgi:hypothetical protein
MNKAILCTLCLFLCLASSCKKEASTDEGADNKDAQDVIILTQPADEGADAEKRRMIAELANVKADTQETKENFINANYQAIVGDGHNALLRFIPNDSPIVLATWARISYDDPKAMGFIQKGAEILRAKLRKLKSSAKTQKNPLALAMLEFSVAALGGINAEKLKQMGFHHEHSLDMVFYLAQDLPVLKLAVSDGAKLQDMLLPYIEDAGIKIEYIKFGNDVWHIFTLSRHMGGKLAVHFGATVVTATVFSEMSQKTRNFQQLIVPAQIHLTSQQLRSRAQGENDLLIGYINTGSLIDNYTRIGIALAEILGVDAANYQLSAQCSKEMRALTDSFPELAYSASAFSAKKSYKIGQKFKLKINNAKIRNLLADVAVAPVIASSESANWSLSRSFNPKHALLAAELLINNLNLPLQCQVLDKINELSQLSASVEDALEVFDNVDAYRDRIIHDESGAHYYISMQGNLEETALEPALSYMNHTVVAAHENEIKIKDEMYKTWTLALNTSATAVQIANASDDFPIHFEPAHRDGEWYHEQSNEKLKSRFYRSEGAAELKLGYALEQFYYYFAFEL